MPQMQAAGRVGADKFHLDLLALACMDTAIVVTLLSDEGNHRVEIAFGQRKVDESRSGNFSLFNRSSALIQMLDNRFSNLPWIAFGNLGQLHCSIGSQISVGFIFWHFQHNRRKLLSGDQASGDDSVRDRFPQPFIG
ncbi:hypothetical protein D3C75_675610 [compost metagenome]